MRTTIERVPTSTLDAFAEAHDLEMVVRERSGEYIHSDMRFSATFKHAEIMDRGLLRSGGGNGPTAEAAIAAYANEISEQRIAIDAMLPTRREFTVPRLVPDDKDAA